MADSSFFTDGGSGSGTFQTIETKIAEAEAAKVAAEAAQAGAEQAETDAQTAEAGSVAAKNTAVASSSNAAISESNAASSSTNASNKALDAQKLAINPEDSQYTLSDGSTTGYSALHYGEKAADSLASATTQASNAAASAVTAGQHKDDAQSAKTAAESARDSALSALDNFEDNYLGDHSSDPTTDGDGDPLTAGSIYFNSTDNVVKVYTGSAWVVAYADGATLVAKAGDTMTGNLSFGDNNKAIFGAGSDLQIYHTGSDSVIADSGTGNLNILGDADVAIINAASTEYKARFITDGAVELYHNGTQKLATTSTGIDITGNATFDDDAKATFGAGSDLQIFHNSANGNSIIKEQGGGILSLQTNGSEISFYDTANAATMATFATGGSVILRHNGSNKFSTTATGINVTGGITTSDNITMTKTNGAVTIQDATNNNKKGQIQQIAGRLILRSRNDAANGSITFEGHNSQEYARFNSSGYLGLGTTSPSALLTVEGATSSTVGTFTGAGSFFNLLTSVGDASVVNSSLYSIDMNRNGSSNAKIDFGRGSSGTDGYLSLSTAGSERLNIASNGDISFYEDTGTTAKLFWDASAEALQIDTNGTGFAIKSSSNAYMVIDRAASNRRAELVFSTASTNVLNSPPFSATADWALGVSDSDELAGDAFYIATASGAGNAKMVITQAGSVGIGATSSPSKTLEVTSDSLSVLKINGYSSSSGLPLYTYNDSGGVGICTGDADSQSQGYANLMYLRDTDNSFSVYLGQAGAATHRMKLEADGDLHVDGNVVAYSTTVSDIRLKKDIAPIEDAVTKVQQLNGCTFTYLKDDRKSAGLIAQHVEKVLPSAVIEDEAVFHGEEGETYKTVQYDQVIGLLVEAVKELKQEIEELKKG
jgi:hypothetical protein